MQFDHIQNQNYINQKNTEMFNESKHILIDIIINN